MWEEKMLQFRSESWLTAVLVQSLKTAQKFCGKCSNINFCRIMKMNETNTEMCQLLPRISTSREQSGQSGTCTVTILTDLSRFCTRKARKPNREGEKGLRFWGVRGASWHQPCQPGWAGEWRQRAGRGRRAPWCPSSPRSRDHPRTPTRRSASSPLRVEHKPVLRLAFQLEVIVCPGSINNLLKLSAVGK